MVSRERPNVPIVAPTRSPESYQRLALPYGIRPILVDLDRLEGWFPNVLNLHPFKYLRFRTERVPPGVALRSAAAGAAGGAARPAAGLKGGPAGDGTAPAD